MLDKKRQSINEGLRPCRGSYSWNDEPRAKDVLRTYVCDIYDCLKDAYSYKVNISEWEKEIAEEAISITVGCWKSYNLGTHYLQLMEPLRNALVLHVGHSLRSGPLQQTGTNPQAYAPSGEDIISGFQATEDSNAKPSVQRHPRREFVEPILENMGWSVLDWSLEAEVSHATAMDYINGKTKPYRSTRVKLAKALDVTVDKLPR